VCPPVPANSSASVFSSHGLRGIFLSIIIYLLIFCPAPQTPAAPKDVVPLPFLYAAALLLPACHSLTCEAVCR
jgi:hypothetical protein